ncbi:MAG: LCP family protein [Anaerolineales bacterium]|nr:LCP family protein [Anaerolineales bacterium]
MNQQEPPRRPPASPPTHPSQGRYPPIQRPSGAPQPANFPPAGADIPGATPTSPSRPAASPPGYRPAARRPKRSHPRSTHRRAPRLPVAGCIGLALILLVAIFFISVYLFFPMRTNILLLGIDYSEATNAISRTDTMILTSFNPWEPYLRLLSIPRDLWVMIPGVGENRINTAHFYAESQANGSGPDAAMETVRLNFGVEVHYYLRIRFEGFRDVIDKLGGVDIELTEPMGGYEPGTYHLTGSKALAFVRYRQGSDDFHRMKQGQFMLKAVYKTMLKPKNWLRIPTVITTLFDWANTNVPVWIWPRLLATLLRTGTSGIDSRVIDRDMVSPFTTPEGAMVLAPNWAAIKPMLIEMFGQ